jgi:glycerate kinase
MSVAFFLFNEAPGKRNLVFKCGEQNPVEGKKGTSAVFYSQRQIFVAKVKHVLNHP